VRAVRTLFPRACGPKPGDEAKPSERIETVEPEGSEGRTYANQCLRAVRGTGLRPYPPTPPAPCGALQRERLSGRLSGDGPKAQELKREGL